MSYFSNKHDARSQTGGTSKGEVKSPRLHRGFVVLLVVLTGCGGPPFALSGLVTYDGKPVPIGELVLMPDPAAGNKGPGVLVDIKDGHYETPPGKGHVGGAYLVRLTGFDGQAAKPGVLVDYRGTALFVDLNEQIDLPAQATKRDFSLTSKRTTK